MNGGRNKKPKIRVSGTPRNIHRMYVVSVALMSPLVHTAASSYAPQRYTFRPPRTASGFEPYDMNGGMVCGVAGSGYVVLACDTRLVSGYEILSRRCSRLWPLGPAEDDGALPSAAVAAGGCLADCEGLRRSLRKSLLDHAAWSCGAAPAALRPTMTAHNVALLLQSALYSRRSFPFYAFCVLGGVDRVAPATAGEDAVPEGAVYAFDAVGSFERVAVGSNGRGREMLQPILDRSFSAAAAGREEEGEGGDHGSALCVRRDRSALSAGDQMSERVALRPPVRTIVDCTAEESVRKVLAAYQAVCEREIDVGDELVVWVLRCDELRKASGEKEEEDARSSEPGEGENEIMERLILPAVEIHRFPLKGH